MALNQVDFATISVKCVRYMPPPQSEHNTSKWECGDANRETEMRDRIKKKQRKNTDEENFFNLIRAILSVFIEAAYISQFISYIKMHRHSTAIFQSVELICCAISFQHKIKPKWERKTQVHEKLCKRKKKLLINWLYFSLVLISFSGWKIQIGSD